MIAKVLGKIGLPLLVKFMGRALLSINNSTAQKAASLLGDVDEAIQKQQISLEELKEANRHVERSLEIEAELDEKTLNTIHQTIRQEMDSPDRFVRFWRPAFGYSVALAWLLMMLTICYTILTDSSHASEIIMALVETTSLWGIALGVLGLSVVKNNPDKLKPHNPVSKFTAKL